MRALLFLLISSGLSWALDISFVSYNLKNFLQMDTFTNGERTGVRYKPDEEIQALIKVISESSPDILGVCEIGTLKDLEKFRKLLKKEGLEYEFVEHVKAADSVRHLALLSKFPIKKVHSRDDLSYSIGKVKYPLRRGLLHVELNVKGVSVHALGVHFKSKRPAQEADESEMRLKESYLVREVLTSFLEENPEELLFIYGDFNDSYKSKTISAIKGHWRSKTRVSPLELKDSRGEYWTHYWDWQREYGVFDYVFCSRALLPKVNMEKSFIIDSKDVLLASDHRPLLVTFSF